MQCETASAGGDFLIGRLLMVGGDQRMLELEKLLQKDGYAVDTLGLHAGDEATAQPEKADAALFPYPFAVRRDCVPALNGLTIHPADVLRRLRPGVPVLAGRGIEICADHPVKRYEDVESLLDQNAALSAEAAVCETMQRTPKALMDMTALVVGYGRFGRALAQRLRALGAEVWAAARRTEMRRLAASEGMQPVTLTNMDAALRKADIVLNTVPAQVLTEDKLRLLSPGVPLLELASAPYGFDRDVAVALGHPCEVLPALPARYAPHSAALALRQAAIRLLEE